MTSSENIGSTGSPDNDQPEYDVTGEASDSGALFKGDKGTLSFELRKVLNLLHLGPFVDGRRHPKIWTSLTHGKAHILSQLHNMGLDLVVDLEHEVAFTRQIEDENFKLPILLRKYKLAFIDSVLLLHLRERVMLASAEGSRAVVSRQDLLDHLLPFELTSGDEVKFLKKRKACIERMVSMQLLNSFGSGEDQYEVSPVIKMIFPAEEIVALTEAFAKMLANPDGFEPSGYETDDVQELFKDTQK